VRVEGRTIGEIQRGVLLLAAFRAHDQEEDLEWMARKCVELRIFGDDEGKLNLGLQEVGGAVLLVSQFTLYGDARKGRRPSFIDSAPPQLARSLYERFEQRLRATGVAVETGSFGAMMQVELVNDGPVTIVLDRDTSAPAATGVP
jgi:D-tyrosyl-tRNA(Tyr) deacylase